MVGGLMFYLEVCAEISSLQRVPKKLLNVLQFDDLYPKLKVLVEKYSEELGLQVCTETLQLKSLVQFDPLPPEL